MKCIQYTSNDTITRVMDETAANAVASGRAKYIAKKIWKEQVRDSGKVKK